MAKKNTTQPYFPLECNNRNKTKILKLRMDYGVAGYGIYIMLMERLRCADGFAEDYDVEALAYDFRTDPEMIDAVICDYNLFELIENGTRFHSPELTGNMAFMEEQRLRRAESARRAALARWGKLPEVDKNTDDVQPLLRFPEFGTKQEGVNNVGIIGIDNECVSMKQDINWKDAVCERHKIEKESANQLIDEFGEFCKCEGKAAHKDMQDAKSHFNRWLGKRPSEATKGEKMEQAKVAKASKIALENRTREKEMEERNEKYRKMMTESQKPADYIRKMGYDPRTTTLVQVMNPEWREQNPPVTAHAV